MLRVGLGVGLGDAEKHEEPACDLAGQFAVDGDLGPGDTLDDSAHVVSTFKLLGAGWYQGLLPCHRQPASIAIDVHIGETDTSFSVSRRIEQGRQSADVSEV